MLRDAVNRVGRGSNNHYYSLPRWGRHAKSPGRLKVSVFQVTSQIHCFEISGCWDWSLPQSTHFCLQAAHLAHMTWRRIINHHPGGPEPRLWSMVEDLRAHKQELLEELWKSDKSRWDGMGCRGFMGLEVVPLCSRFPNLSPRKVVWCLPLCQPLNRGGFLESWDYVSFTIVSPVAT